MVDVLHRLVVEQLGPGGGSVEAQQSDRRRSEESANDVSRMHILSRSLVAEMRAVALRGAEAAKVTDDADRRRGSHVKDTHDVRGGLVNSVGPVVGQDGVLTELCRQGVPHGAGELVLQPSVSMEDVVTARLMAQRCPTQEP